MQHLSGMDGAFLALETSTTHLHVVGTIVFAPQANDRSVASGPLSVARVRATVAERLIQVAPFRTRLAPAPLGLAQPGLVEEEVVELDYHVRRASLPAPGGRAELEALVADLAARPLDRSRPLWEFHVVEGLAEGRTALVAKIHHAIIDGVSGAELVAAFFDLSPEPDRPTVTALRPGTVTQAPAVGRQGADLRDVVAAVPGQVEALARAVLGLSGRVRTGSADGQGEAGGLSRREAPGFFDAPRTSFNRAISSHRRVVFGNIPLAEVQRIRGVLGGSTNDVVLCLVAGGLRRLLATRGESPDRSLVAMVPVSVRAESERGTLGNRLSAMLVSLATGVEDPALRLKEIALESSESKQRVEAAGPDRYRRWAEALAPAVSGWVSRTVTSSRLFDRVGPPFNVVVSNIPGPEVPLYLAGYPVEALYPIGPVVEGVGMNVTVFSYCGSIGIGIQACWDLLPDVDVVLSGMRGELAALGRAATRPGRKVPWWHTELPA
jgi:diacylglycerol O-acyltransferase / wax synthase